MLLKWHYRKKNILLLLLQHRIGTTPTMTYSYDSEDDWPGLYVIYYNTINTLYFTSDTDNCKH